MYGTKATLRARLQNIRQSLSDEQHQRKDRIIAEELLAGYDWSMVRLVLIYRSQPHFGEVATDLICELLHTYHPHLSIDIAPLDPTIAPPLRPLYDVVIMPVLGYDSSGNRLGMGAGWYDRLLVAQPQAYRIGLAYTELRLSAIPIEAHDQQLDHIIAA